MLYSLTIELDQCNFKFMAKISKKASATTKQVALRREMRKRHSGAKASLNSNKKGASLRFAPFFTLQTLLIHACSAISINTDYFLAVPTSTRLFNFWPGRKVTTQRAEIGISSPVFGLRPGR